jgi:hypothetical protein
MGWERFGSESNGNELKHSSSGEVQLPPKDGNEPTLPLEDMDESENPDDDAGRLGVSLRLA